MRVVSPGFLGAILVCLLAGAGTASAEESETVELEDIQVTGMSQELGLRTIKMALDAQRSHRLEDRDDLVCWYDKAVGSHLTQLYCATNRTLENAGDFGSSTVGGPATGASSAAQNKIWSWRVNRAEFEAALERLGPAALNEEILGRALKGEELPENVPTQAELERFSQAMAQVREIAGNYDPRIAKASGEERVNLVAESDRMMADAIGGTGLTVDRYNEISDLVSRYDSLREIVRERLAAR